MSPLPADTKHPADTKRYHNQTALDFQEAIIGGLLLDKNAITRIAEKLHPRYFSTRTFQQIIECIIDLHSRQVLIDMMTVCNEMESRGHRGDWKNLMFRCLQSTVSAVNIDAYLDSLIELYSQQDYDDITGDLTPYGLTRLIREIETSNKKDPEKMIALFELGEISGMHPIEWGKLIKSVRDEITKEQENSRLINDFKLLVAEKDFIKGMMLRAKLKQQYKLSEKQLEGILAHVSGLSTIAKPESYNLLDFLELDVDAGHVLFPGVPAKGVTLIGGEPGTGKTLFAFALAKAVSEGCFLLGEKPTHQGSALLVTSDETIADTQDKLMLLGLSDEKTRVITDWNIQNWEHLENDVRETQPALIVIDSFASIHSRGFDENTVDAACTINDLTRLSQQHNCAVILLHHLSKEGKFRGSTAIPAACAATIMITGKERDPRNIKTHKCRIQGGEIDILYRLDEYYWPQKTSSNMLKVDFSIAKQIINYLYKKGCAEVKELAIFLSKTTDCIRVVLGRLKSRGVVKCKVGKKDKRRRIWELRQKEEIETLCTEEPKRYNEARNNKVEAEIQSSEGVEVNNTLKTGTEEKEVFRFPEDSADKDLGEKPEQSPGGGDRSSQENSSPSPPEVFRFSSEEQTEQALDQTVTPPETVTSSGEEASRQESTSPGGESGQTLGEDDTIKTNFSSEENGSNTNNKKQDLSLLKPGDKAMYKSLQFLVKLNDVDRKILFPECGGKFSYDECHLPCFPSFCLGELISYNGKPATYAGKSDNNWEVIIIPQGYTKQMVVNIDECSKL